MLHGEMSCIPKGYEKTFATSLGTDDKLCTSCNLRNYCGTNQKTSSNKFVCFSRQFDEKNRQIDRNLLPDLKVVLCMYNLKNHVYIPQYVELNLQRKSLSHFLAKHS